MKTPAKMPTQERVKAALALLAELDKGNEFVAQLCRTVRLAVGTYRAFGVLDLHINALHLGTTRAAGGDAVSIHATADCEILEEVFVSGPLEALVAEIYRIAEIFDADADADDVSYA